MGEQRERNLVLTALHLLVLGRGHRDSGQSEITRTRGGGGGCYKLGWAGPRMQLGQGYLSPGLTAWQPQQPAL